MLEFRRSSQEQGFVKRTRLVGRVDAISVEKVMKDIDAANEHDEVSSIRMTIASGGGSLRDGFALYDHIKYSEKPVDIIAAGYCMSAAVTILQAGRKRLSYPNATFMVHPSSIAMGSQPYNEAMETMKQYDKDHDLSIKLTCERAGITRQELESMYEPKMYLTPQEAKNLGPHGLIDEIIVFKK